MLASPLDKAKISPRLLSGQDTGGDQQEIIVMMVVGIMEEVVVGIHDHREIINITIRTVSHVIKWRTARPSSLVIKLADNTP